MALPMAPASTTRDEDVCSDSVFNCAPTNAPAMSPRRLGWNTRRSGAGAIGSLPGVEQGLEKLRETIPPDQISGRVDFAYEDL